MSLIIEDILELPDVLPAGVGADPERAFRRLADTAALWYAPGGRVLIVSFDNLATLDHPYPRKPWLLSRLQELGYSVLGVQSFAKDWYRNPDAAPLLRGLEAEGFFRTFDRVIFIGASMGAFAAINLATLVPDAVVIALSPQSTMSKAIAPFEDRFRWAVRRSDWTTPDFLDAAISARRLSQLVLLYDGSETNDRLHAERLNGPNVQLLRVDHSTHEAVRVVLKCGALAPLIRDVAATGRVGPDFWTAMRNRRSVRKWARTFFSAVTAKGQPRRIRAAASALLKQEDYLFVTQALKSLEQK